MRYILIVLLLTGCGSKEIDSKSDISFGVDKKISQYLQTADHLTETQKKAMIQRSPFLGMTKEEADLAMHYENADMYHSMTTVQAIYTGRGGVKYYLYFEGNPPRVIDWYSPQ